MRQDEGVGTDIQPEDVLHLAWTWAKFDPTDPVDRAYRAGVIEALVKLSQELRAVQDWRAGV